MNYLFKFHKVCLKLRESDFHGSCVQWYNSCGWDCLIAINTSVRVRFDGFSRISLIVVIYSWFSLLPALNTEFRNINHEWQQPRLCGYIPLQNDFLFDNEWPVIRYFSWNFWCLFLNTRSWRFVGKVQNIWLWVRQSGKALKFCISNKKEMESTVFPSIVISRCLKWHL